MPTCISGRFPVQESNRGFTIPEFMIASFIGFLSMTLVWTAFMGFQFQTRTTFAQTLGRMNTQNAMERIGRIIMESTRLNVEPDEVGLGIIHLWRDTQLVWTPDTTEDDVEGILFYDPDGQKVWYRPDINDTSRDELVADKIEGITFELVGEAAFVTIQTDYDVDPNFDSNTTETMRETYGSFAVRNNPRIRVGATF